MVTLKCIRCGEPFDAKTDRAQYCERCRAESYKRRHHNTDCREREWVSEYSNGVREREKKLADKAAEARRLGTTYGKLAAPEVTVNIPKWARGW